jgi:hypothetical protein
MHLRSEDILEVIFVLNSGTSLSLFLLLLRLRGLLSRRLLAKQRHTAHPALIGITGLKTSTDFYLTDVCSFVTDTYTLRVLFLYPDV